MMTHAVRSIVVTGASTGIGLSTTKALTNGGFHVFGSVRRQEDATRLQDAFGDLFSPLLFDVTDAPAVAAAAALVRDRLNGKTLLGLVNNAGIALGGPLLHLPVDTFRRQLEVNLTGVLVATQAFAPLLGTDTSLEGGPGRIVNVGSIGGRHAFPFMVPYHVSKYGLEGFTEGLRRELMPYGIDAILVAPGSVATPIWEKADQQDQSAYKDTPYKDVLASFNDLVQTTGKNGVPAERIGAVILKALTVPRPKTYYRVTSAPFAFHLLTKLPKRWVDRAIARQIGLPRRFQ